MQEMFRKLLSWPLLLSLVALSSSCDWLCPEDPVWEYRQDMITARAYCAAVVLDSQLYVIAGHHSTGSSVANRGKFNESYDPATDDWTSHAVAPHDSYNACAAAVGDFIYVFGGVNIGGNYSRNSVDRYSAGGNSWTSDFDVYPYAGIEGARALSYGDKIYIFGGRYYVAGSPYEYRNKAYVFDPAAGAGSRFTELAPMPEARADFGVVLMGDKIHCIAGSGSGGELNRHDVYDISSNTWITGLRQLPVTAAAPACGGMDAKIYAITGRWGGGGSDLEAESATYEYDPVSDEWTEKDPPHTARLSPACGEIDGKLYLAGGIVWSNGTSVTNCTADHEEATSNPGDFIWP
jgi:N-acetylneuraminic acid mutarotase